MKTYTSEQLSEILRLHRLWRDGDPKGVRANLADANLAGADLAGANLAGADLAGARLAGANLAGANLAGADLAGAYLTGANLAGADLAGANLAGADLAGADLAGAYLTGANLRSAVLARAYLTGAHLTGAYLAGANLAGADLAGADLAGAYLNPKTILPPHSLVPEEGSFVAFKAVDGAILKLQIPARAQRLTPIGSRKCRASYAKVLAVVVGKGKTFKSRHTTECTYRVGKITRPDKWDPDIRVECSHGIHFFMTLAEARAWGNM